MLSLTYLAWEKQQLTQWLALKGGESRRIFHIPAAMLLVTARLTWQGWNPDVWETSCRFVYVQLFIYKDLKNIWNHIQYITTCCTCSHTIKVHWLYVYVVSVAYYDYCIIAGHFKVRALKSLLFLITECNIDSTDSDSREDVSDCTHTNTHYSMGWFLETIIQLCVYSGHLLPCSTFFSFVKCAQGVMWPAVMWHAQANVVAGILN